MPQNAELQNRKADQSKIETKKKAKTNSTVY